MKKGLKSILICGGIALVVGLGLIVAGIVAGASWFDVGDVIFSGKYSIGSNVTWGIGRSRDMESDKLEGEANVLKDIDAKDIKKLNIEMAAGRLDIKVGKSEYLQVNNDEKRGDCYVNHVGNELTITINGKHNNSRGARTTLWIPSGLTIADTNIRVDAGKVDVEEINATDLTIKVGAGQAITGTINATTLDVEVDAGEFKSKGKVTADVVELEVAAGSLNVDLLEARHADLNVDVGHIKVKFAGKESDYNIEAKCDLGTVKIGNSTHHLGKGHQSHNPSVNKTIEVDCNVGQATINFNN